MTQGQFHLNILSLGLLTLPNSRYLHHQAGYNAKVSLSRLRYNWNGPEAVVEGNNL